MRLGLNLGNQNDWWADDSTPSVQFIKLSNSKKYGSSKAEICFYEEKTTYAKEIDRILLIKVKFHIYKNKFSLNERGISIPWRNVK